MAAKLLARCNCYWYEVDFQRCLKDSIYLQYVLNQVKVMHHLNNKQPLWRSHINFLHPQLNETCMLSRQRLFSPWSRWPGPKAVALCWCSCYFAERTSSESCCCPGWSWLAELEIVMIGPWQMQTKVGDQKKKKWSLCHSDCRIKKEIMISVWVCYLTFDWFWLCWGSGGCSEAPIGNSKRGLQKKKITISTS